MGIHIKVLQKFGSTIDEIISKALQISGTYQILLGFCLIIKKQPVAINISFIILDIVPVWLCGVINASETNVTMVAIIKVKNANTPLGTSDKKDFFSFGFHLLFVFNDYLYEADKPACISSRYIYPSSLRVQALRILCTASGSSKRHHQCKNSDGNDANCPPVSVRTGKVDSPAQQSIPF